jgi:hypothetical protein
MLQTQDKRSGVFGEIAGALFRSEIKFYRGEMKLIERLSSKLECTCGY